MPATSPGDSPNPENCTPEISVEELHDALNSDHPGFLLDVRTSAEFIEARIPFVNRQISHQVVPSYPDLIPTEKNQPVYVVCRSGSRSADVTEYLRAKGYSRAFNVAGGILAWIDAGFATDKGPVQLKNGGTKK